MVTDTAELQPQTTHDPKAHLRKGGRPKGAPDLRPRRRKNPLAGILTPHKLAATNSLSLTNTESEDLSEHARREMELDVIGAIEGLKRYPPTLMPLVGLKMREEVAANLTKRAATLFGWDAKTIAGTISIGKMEVVIQQSRPSPDAQSQVDRLKSNVIEAECVNPVRIERKPKIEIPFDDDDESEVSPQGGS